MSQYLDKDGASRIAENFLSKQAEQDAILANLQFDLKEAEHALVKTIQGPAPLNIRALTRPLDDYAISGNTVQDGTPTPEDPVDVQGCGEKTENLFNGTWEYGSIGATGGNIDSPSSIRTGYIPISTGNYSYYCNYNPSECWWNAYTDTSFISRGQISRHTFTLPEGTKRVRFRMTKNSNIGLNPDFSVVQSDVPPATYEPYGYKLPLTVNGTEYPIYLGQVLTTRRIRKLVLDGTESTWLEYNNLNLFRVPDTSKDYRSQADGAICDSLPLVPRGDLTTNTFCWSSGTVGEFIININNYNLADLRTYLSSNPITIWYVLAEPETAVVNEPLHKIGDYADTISMAQTGVTLTTTKGFNTITTDTTVLPSNIEVKGVINNA